MIDIRYHLTSLVAVFFALGLGMLVGAQLAHEGALTQEYARLVERVEVGLERMREDNRRLEAQLAEVDRQLSRERAFSDGVLEELVVGRLPGVGIGLVVQGELDGRWDRVSTVLNRAGADVVVFDDVEALATEEAENRLLVHLWDGRDEPRVLEGSVRAWSDTAARPTAEEGAEGVADAQVVSNIGTAPGLLRLVAILRDLAGLEQDASDSERPGAEEGAGQDMGASEDGTAGWRP